MRVAFYLDLDAPEFVRMALIAIASVRRAMPQARILHLTTTDGPRLAGTDGEVRVRCEGHVTWRRAVVQSIVDGPALFLDVDVVMRRGCEAFWRDDADVVLPVVRDPAVRHTGGVVWARDPAAFWGRWARDPIHAQPFDVRRFLVAFTHYVAGYGARAQFLAEQDYERLPAGPEMPDAYLVHYRGPRKRWFPAAVEWATATS